MFAWIEASAFSASRGGDVPPEIVRLLPHDNHLDKLMMQKTQPWHTYPECLSLTRVGILAAGPQKVLLFLGPLFPYYWRQKKVKSKA